MALSQQLFSIVSIFYVTFGVMKDILLYGVGEQRKRCSACTERAKLYQSRHAKGRLTHFRTAVAQISLRIHTVWSGALLFAHIDYGP